ncbi:MAG: biotin--[acetyl-CoA-carboxylase] ligase [Chitinispirillales bacterium]|jgi:BirA family biotin operon repressor/biotin-[acetyl-CoA-carboxylase] ligase|nr:biotin--[acetyl-CoA-carboxylase] ligase [Chitinispirillales bacterium]
MRYVYLDEIDSTNSYAKSLCCYPQDEQPGAGSTRARANNFSRGELTVIRAKRQRGGRGRDGNAFFSDHAGGLWATIITRIADISTHFEHNRAISLSIRKALCECMPAPSAPISIKWPNDIYWGDKKIAGILLENATQNPNALIIGFGININIAADDFPAELRGKATSVLMETGDEHMPGAVLEGILREYSFILKHGSQGAHTVYAGSLYKKGCLAAVGQHRGIFSTVELDGRLRLETNQGSMLLSSGTLRFLEGAGCE